MEGEVAPAALDLAEEGPVDAAPGCEGFLAEPLSFAALTDSIAKEAGGFGERLRHAGPTSYVPTNYVQSVNVPCARVLLELRCYADVRKF